MVKKFRKKVSLICISVIIFIAVLAVSISKEHIDISAIQASDVYRYNAEQVENTDHVFLSDLEYLNDLPYNGWSEHSIEKDMFIKGLGIHAKGQVAYDISKLSNNNENLANTIAMPIQAENSDFIYLSDVPYIKDISGSIDWLHEVSYYDELLKDIDDNKILGDKELLLYQRDFISKAGYDNLVMLAESSSDYEESIKWLFESKENLKMYLISGAPDGSYITSMQVLCDLYKNYHEDFDNQNPTKYGYTTLGTLYRRMAISLSLTHSKTTYFWMNGAKVEQTNSNAVERYSIFKEIYLSGRMRFTSTIDFAEWFEQYEIGEMRYVMNSIMDDDEMIWLNEYTQSFIDANKGNEMWYLSPHPYMKYVQPNYSRPEYYDEAYKDYYDEKYKGIFSKYNVPFGELGVARTWMNLESGAVCGGISKLGASNRNAHGVPATVVSQPGHAAFAYYMMDNNGDGYWTLNNTVTDWEQSGKTERLNDLMPLGWGNDSYVNGYAASYILLSQEAMNHNEQYELSKKYYMIADMYQNDAAKRKEYLKKSLDALPYNIDSWWALIKLYNANPNTTEEEYFELACDLADALMPFPLPMKNLLDQLSNKFTSSDYIFNYNLLVINTLTEAKNLTDGSRVRQPGNTRTIANFLLGNVDKGLATFSFDDTWYPGYIVLRSNLYGMDVNWDYSLDGKKTWTDVYSQANNSHFIKLTSEELASITAENDIYVHIKGVNLEYNDRNTFKIDITTGDYSSYASSVYLNDLENRLIGVNNKLEWKFPEDDKWTPYANSEPDLKGNKTVSVRVKATGTALPSSSQDYTFTEDSENPKKKYIPVRHLLSVYDYISESVDTSRPYYAKNIIDATPKTLWHSDFRVSVQDSPIKPYISIELDSPRYISALDFLQVKYKSNDTDKILNATVYVSTDGTAWNKAGTIQNCNNYGQLYTIDFPKSVYGKYVKFEMETDKPFVSLAMINLYEDTTEIFSANFSFDGDNANQLVINDDNVNYDWEYTLDAGNNWKPATGTNKKYQELTPEELAQINVNDNIAVRKKEKDSYKEYTIDFYEGLVPEGAYLNDLENRLIAVPNSETVEWTYDINGEWTSYSEEEPITLGNKTLYIRTKATGTTLASDYIEYKFTEDNQLQNRKYIPVDNLSIHYVSSEGIDIYTDYDPNVPEDDYQDIQYASYMIDGNPNTFWHTSYENYDPNVKKELTIKLNEAKYISALEYLPYEGLGGSGLGKPEKMEIYISLDDVVYEKIAETDWKYNYGDINLRTIDFEPTFGQYIKLVGKQTIR